MLDKVFITGYACVVPKSLDECYLNVYGDRKIQRFSRRSGTLYMAALKNALEKSKIDLSKVNSFRTAIILGEYMNQKPDFDSIVKVLKQCSNEASNDKFDDGLYHKHSIKHWSATNSLSYVPNIPAFLCALSMQSKGYLSTELLTCAGGLFSITEGYEKIKDGCYDIAIVGGTSSKLNLFEEIKYKSMGYFDKNDYSISEGAGAVILESENSISKRAFKPYAEIVGIANSFSPLTYKLKEFDSKSFKFLLEQLIDSAGLDKENPVNYYPGSFSSKNTHEEYKYVNEILKNIKFIQPTAKNKHGYTFAASGVLEVVEAIESFKENFNNIAIISALGVGGHNTSIAIKEV